MSLAGESLCLNCGYLDTGTYCSNCSNRLSIPPEKTEEIIKRRLEQIAFVPAESTISSTNWHEDIKQLIIKIHLLMPFTLVYEDFILSNQHLNVISIIPNTELCDTILHNIQDLNQQIYNMDSIFRKSRIVRLKIYILVIFKEDCSLDDLKNLKNNNHSALKWRFYYFIKFIACDIPHRKVNCSKLLPIYKPVQIALKQVSSTQSKENQGSIERHFTLSDLLSVAAQPFLEFYIGFSHLSRPSYMAKRISSHQIHMIDLLRYLFAAVVITALVNKILGFNRLMFDITGLPIISDIIASFILILIAIIGTVIFHFPLKLVGGKGSILQTFYVTMYANLTLLPITTVLDSVLSKYQIQKPLGMYMGIILYMCTLYSLVHELKFWRTSITIIITIIFFNIFIPILILEFFQY